MHAAANRLGVSRTTVLRRISGLEADIGTRLFHRSTEGYELTERGTGVLAYAEKVEAALFELEHAAYGGKQTVVGKVRIGATEGFGSTFIAPYLVELHRRHPDLDVELLALPGFVDMFKRQADLSITLEPPTYGRLVVKKLTDYILRVYASADYLESHPPITAIKDLQDHCLIDYIDDLRISDQLYFLTDTLPGAHAKLTSTSIVAQCKLVSSGAGLAILPSFMARREPDLVVVLPKLVKIKRTFWIVTPSDLSQLPHIRAVKDFLAELVRIKRDLLM